MRSKGVNVIEGIKLKIISGQELTLTEMLLYGDYLNNEVAPPELKQQYPTFTEKKSRTIIKKSTSLEIYFDNS